MRRAARALNGGGRFILHIYYTRRAEMPILRAFLRVITTEPEE